MERRTRREGEMVGGIEKGSDRWREKNGKIEIGRWNMGAEDGARDRGMIEKDGEKDGRVSREGAEDGGGERERSSGKVNES